MVLANWQRCIRMNQSTEFASGQCMSKLSSTFRELFFENEKLQVIWKVCCYRRVGGSLRIKVSFDFFFGRKKINLFFVSLPFASLCDTVTDSKAIEWRYLDSLVSNELRLFKTCFPIRFNLQENETCGMWSVL